MTREEAIEQLQYCKGLIKQNGQVYLDERDFPLLDMAIEALQNEPIRCGECKHKDECEELVLFEVNDEEVMGHRLNWCSYAEREEP